MNLVVVLIFSMISSEPYVAERAFVALSIMTAIKAPFMVLPFMVDGVSQVSSIKYNNKPWDRDLSLDVYNDTRGLHNIL